MTSDGLEAYLAESDKHKKNKDALKEDESGVDIEGSGRLSILSHQLPTVTLYKVRQTLFLLKLN